MPRPQPSRTRSIFDSMAATLSADTTGKAPALPELTRAIEPIAARKASDRILQILCKLGYDTAEYSGARPQGVNSRIGVLHASRNRDRKDLSAGARSSPTIALECEVEQTTCAGNGGSPCTATARLRASALRRGSLRLLRYTKALPACRAVACEKQFQREPAYALRATARHPPRRPCRAGSFRRRESNRPAFAQARFGAAAFACFAILRHCRLAEP